MSNEKLNEWLARELFGLVGVTRCIYVERQDLTSGYVLEADPQGDVLGYNMHEYVADIVPDYAGTYDGMGLVIKALHARKDTTYLIDMSAEYGNGGKLVWRVNVCTPRNSYCWRDAYGPLWESLPLGVAESVKKAIELERASAQSK